MGSVETSKGKNVERRAHLRWYESGMQRGDFTSWEPVVAAMVMLLAGCGSTPEGTAARHSSTDSLLAPTARECAFRSVCTGEAIGDCVRFVRDGDAIEIEGQTRRQALLEHAACVGKASTCDDYFACVYPGAHRASCDPNSSICTGDQLDQCVSLGDAGTLALTTDCTAANETCRTVDGAGACLPAYACGRTESAYCSGNVLVWCYQPENGTPRPIPLDCARSGLVCDSTLCRDEPPRACTTDACDGPMVRHCVQNVAYSLDCRVVDPSFTCYSDSGTLRCGASQPDARCPLESGPSSPSGPSTFSGQNVWCEGDVAKACVSGTVLAVDCGAVGASCVGATPYEVRCRSR